MMRMLTPVAAALASALLAASATAQTVVLHSSMDGSQETPVPVATAGTGFATVTLDTSTGAVSVSGTYTGLTGTQTLAHIHGPAAAGAGAGVVVTLSGTGGTSGTVSGSGFLTAGQINDMLAGLHYVNIHSTFASNGEIRGQICLPAAATSRNPGSNPASYTASAPLIGGTLNATVDLNTTGHTTAFLFAFDTPVAFVLGGGQQLLCLNVGGSGELFSGAGVAPTSVVGGIASFSYSIPFDASLCNFNMYSQALHAFGVVPFALSNAQDLVLGF